MIVHDAVNRVMRLRVGAEDFAVRMPHMDDSQLHIDRASEQAAIKAADAAGLAPHVVSFDVATGVMITGWIDTPVWTAEQAREPERIDCMARVLRRLHSVAPPQGVRRLDLEAQLHSNSLALADAHWPRPDDFLALQAAAMHHLQQRRIRKPVLCHNDLNCQNIIGTGADLRLLDWEYAGLGNPLFDLASYAQSNDLEAGEKLRLLDAYNAGASMQAEFTAECRLFDWVCALWLAVSGQHETAAGGARLTALCNRLRNPSA